MSDDIGHGMREMLATLDPERSDAGYWHRFHRWVLNAAAPELARRRRKRPMTVSEMVFSWWRALVPIAMATAALAGALLLSERPNASPVANLDVEEMLLEGTEAPVMPVFETAAPDGEIVLASEPF